VSTIFRTGDKLSVKESSDDAAACALCGVPVNLDPSPLSNLTDGLHHVGLDAATKTAPPSNDCCSGCDSACTSLSSDPQLTKEGFVQALCYGCQLTMRDTKLDLTDLPSYFVKAANKAQHRAQMKEQIKDFLLDD